jgi:N-acyl-D-amino-acid deacylase
MGLMYAPENYYSFDDLVELAKVLRRYGGVLATHIRGEGNNLISSINEVIKIAEKAQVPLHISHLKAAGRNNWGEKLQIAMETILKWRAKGMDITCDVYPYEAGSTSLFTLLPPSILEDGMEEMVKKLKDKDVRNWVKKELSLEHSDWDNLMYSLGWDSVVISSVNNEKNKLFIGKSIEEIAQNYGKDAVDCLLDLIVSENGKTGMVMFHMSPNDVRQVLKWENSIIVSDSLYPGKGLPHPRLYGSFTRVLAKYVRDEKLLTIEEAVRKMTSFPAWRMSIEDKGLIKEGYHADMVLFDIENIEDTATYIDPINYSKGFDYVFMSGKEVIVNDKINDVFYGKYMQRS